MKSCKEISILTEKSAYEKLSIGEKMSLFFHKMICVLCKKYASESKNLSSALKEQEKRTHTLSIEEKEKIRNAIIQS